MRLPIFALLAFAPLLATSPAMGQPGGDDIITVRGVQERRFDTPASVARIGDGQASALRTLDEAAALVPGLSMINDQDPGTNIVALRGVTTDRLQQAAIVYVLDGVALADTEFFTGPLFDLAGVDVLRGPQGALFGKGAAGGVVAIASNKPGAPGYALIGLGDGGYRIGEAAATVLDATAGWSARIAGQWRAADGWIKNRTLNALVDAEESRAVRVRAEGPVGAALVEVGGFWMLDDGGAAWASSGDVTGDFGGALDGAALTDPIGDFEGRSRREWTQIRSGVRFTLGAGEVSLALARDRYRKRWVEELDYRPGPLTFFGVPAFPDGLQPIAQPTDIEATTADARWTGALGGMNVIVGVFAQDVDRARIDDFGPLLFGGGPLDYVTNSLQTAAFAGAFRTTGAWRLEAQARYDRDGRTQTISAGGLRQSRRRADFARLQPRLAVSYAATPNAVAYASYGEGFRSGGFNPQPTPGSIWRPQFAPESTRSGEAGVRLRSRADGPVTWRLEAAGFVAAISDYQNYTFLDGQSVTLTVDQVSVRGGEASFKVETRTEQGWGFGLDGGAALSDTAIDRYVAPDPLVPGATRDYSGRRVPNAPTWTGAISARASLTNTPNLRTELSLTLNGAGETFFEIDNALRAPARAWLDARASFSVDGWTASVWGRNITDERWAISAFGQGMLPLLAGLGPNGPFDTFTINRGRQAGLDLRKAF